MVLKSARSDVWGEYSKAIHLWKILPPMDIINRYILCFGGKVF